MRYLYIDNHSGRVWADLYADGPVAGALTIAAGHGDYGRLHTTVPRRELASNETGYHVYSVPDSHPETVDGSDPRTIAAARTDGTYVCTIRVFET